MYANLSAMQNKAENNMLKNLDHGHPVASGLVLDDAGKHRKSYYTFASIVSSGSKFAAFRQNTGTCAAINLKFRYLALGLKF